MWKLPVMSRSPSLRNAKLTRLVSPAAVKPSTRCPAIMFTTSELSQPEGVNAARLGFSSRRLV